VRNELLLGQKTVYRMMLKERKKQNNAATSRGVAIERNRIVQLLAGLWQLKETEKCSY